MTIEQLLSRISDTGIEDDTLGAVLDNLFSGEINVRTFSLPTDKKVESINDPNMKATIVNYEVLIFKSTVKKLEELSPERLSEFGIDGTILSKLKSLTDEQIKTYINNTLIPNNDRSLAQAIPLIYIMSKLNDMFGSQKANIFETKEQVTEYKKRGKRPERYTKRIYLNIPMDSVGLEFLKLFKLKCIEKGIPSKMKGMGSSGYEVGHLDTTIIYSNDHYLLEHVSILESLIQDRPDLFKKFGTPVISGGRVKSNDGKCYYTLSSGLLNDTTSNSYYDNLYKISFAVMCARINSGMKVDINLINKLSSMNTTDLSNFISNQKHILIENMRNKHITKKDLIPEYKPIVKAVSSYLRFGDIEHCDIPIYQDEIFFNFLKKSSEEFIETAETVEKFNEKEAILYKTEDMFEHVFHQYVSSELPPAEAAKKYVESSWFILLEYRKQARQTIGFPGSPRHKIVSEYIRNIPIFEPFERDPSKGNYINKVNEEKYYLEIAEKLNKVTRGSNGGPKNKNTR